MVVGSLRMVMDDELEHFIKERKARVAEDKASLSRDPPYMEMKAKPDRGYVSKENIPPMSITQGKEESCSIGLPLGVEYERKKQRLQNELRMDYRRYLAEKKHIEPVKSRPFIHLNNCTSAEKDPLDNPARRPALQRDAATLTEERIVSHRPLRFRYREEDGEHSSLLHRRHERLQSESEEELFFREDQETTGGISYRHVGVEAGPERRRTAGIQSSERRGNPSGTARDGRRSKAQSRNEEAEFATGLIIGAADTDEVLQRKKDRYRKELQDQIAEQHRNKQREKDLELKVAATGANDPEKQPDRIRQFGLSRRKDLHVSEPLPTGESATSSLCRPPPRSEKMAVREREVPPPDQPHVAFQSPLLEYSSALGLGGLGGPGVLGGGMFSSNSHPAAPAFPTAMDIHRNPPFGLHPPSSLSEAYRSPYAEPHHYYGSRNLPDPNAAYYGHLSVPGVGLPVSYWTSPPGGAVPSQFGTHSPHSQFSGSSFPEPQLLLNTEAVTDSHTRNVPSEVPRSTRERIQSYRDALKQQEAFIGGSSESYSKIQEQQERRRREREDKERYEAQLEADMKKYQPWGRGGGGAPLRDSTGNLITDLNQMHKLNEEAYINPEQWQRRATAATAAPAAPRTEHVDPNDRVSGFTHVQTSQFARGNVFSSQPTEQQLHERDKYKACLKQQIEEKMRIKTEEKERERLEEEKEEKRLAEQRARIQREFEEEQEKKKQKDMEQKAKNEELMQLAEQKKKEMERKKMEAEEKENEALRKQSERERWAQVEEVCRQPSPPIPTLQRRPWQQQYTPRPPTVDSQHSAAPLSEHSVSDLQSPPVPARRNQLRAAGDQGDLISELARLRRHLCNEQKVLEERLQQEEREELESPLSCRHRYRPTMDVFEMARRRRQVPVRKPSPGNMEPHKLMRIHDSLQLRYSDAESRLEEEDAGERKRRDISDPYRQASRSTFQDDYSDLSLLRQHDHLRSEMESARGSLLESESALIDPLEALSLPQTPEVEKSRYLSARERRRLNKHSQQHRASSSHPTVHTGSQLQQEVKQLGDWSSWSRGRRLVALGQRGNTAGPSDMSDDEFRPPRFSLHGLNRQSSEETVDTDIWTRPETSDTFKYFKRP